MQKDLKHFSPTRGNNEIVLISRLLKNSGCSKIVRSLQPQKAPRRRSSATLHKEAFEDGGEMAVFQQHVRGEDGELHR